VHEEPARLRVAGDPAVHAIDGGLDRVADPQQRGLGAQRRNPEAVGIDLTLRRERGRRLQQPEVGLDVVTPGVQCEHTTHATGDSTRPAAAPGERLRVAAHVLAQPDDLGRLVA
jgi:hypothetical protein